MLNIIGIIAIIGIMAFAIHLLVNAIKKDQQEQDERMLVLEKRLQEYKKLIVTAKMDLEDNLYKKQEEINDLEYRISKLERSKKRSKKGSDKE